MMEIKKQNRNTNMDWNALDRCWAEQYEEDYGNFFHNTIRISSSVSNVEAGMLVSA